MKIPKKLIFNFFTKRFFEQAESYSVFGSRLGSMFADFSFILGLVGPIFFVLFIPMFIIFGTLDYVSVFLPMLIGFLPFSFITFLIINKDFYRGKSIAKRYFGLQIVDIKNNDPASEMQCLVRNSTMIIWPIELLITMFNPTRRLGDFIAGTKVIDSEKENPELIIEEINTRKLTENKSKILWTSIIISLLFSILTMLPSFISLI